MRARDGCNLCGWHTNWYENDPVGRWHITLEVMGHMRAHHPDLYRTGWPQEVRDAFEAGILHKPEFELIAILENLGGQDAPRP